MLQFYTKDQVDEIATIVGTELRNNKMTTSDSTQSFIEALDSAITEKTTPVNLSLITNCGLPGIWDLKMTPEDLELGNSSGKAKLFAGVQEAYDYIFNRSSIKLNTQDFEIKGNSNNIELEGIYGVTPPKLTGRLILAYDKDTYIPITREIDLSSITNREESGTWEASIYAPDGVLNARSSGPIAQSVIETMILTGLNVAPETLDIVDAPEDIVAPPGYGVRLAIPRASGFADDPNSSYRFTGSLLVYVKLRDYEVYDLKSTNFKYNGSYVYSQDGQDTLVVKDATKTPETIASEVIAAIVAQATAYSSYRITATDLTYTIDPQGIIELKGVPESDNVVVKGSFKLTLDIVVEKEPLINLSTTSNVGTPGVWEIPYPGLADENFDYYAVLATTINEIATSLGVTSPLSFDLDMSGRSINKQWDSIGIYHYNLRGDEDVIGDLRIRFVGAEPYPTEVDLNTLSNIGEPGIWFLDKDTLNNGNLNYENDVKSLEVLSSIFEGTTWTPTLNNTSLTKLTDHFTVSEKYSNTRRPGKLAGVLTGYYVSKIGGEFEALKGKIDLLTLLPPDSTELEIALPYPEDITIKQLIEAVTLKINEVATNPITSNQIIGYFVNKPSARIVGVDGLLGAGIKNSIIVRAVSDGSEAPIVDLSTSGNNGDTGRDYFVDSLVGWKANIDQVVLGILADINEFKGSDLVLEDVYYEIYNNIIHMQKAPGSKRVEGVTYVSIKETPAR